MNAEIRDQKKQKRSIKRKQKALELYIEAVEETYGPIVSWPYLPRTRRDPEKMKVGLQKGIEQLQRELQSAKC